MKEYKVLTAISAGEAEAVMNQMAQEGWVVNSTAAVGNLRIIITFERNA